MINKYLYLKLSITLLVIKDGLFHRQAENVTTIDMKNYMA